MRQPSVLTTFHDLEKCHGMGAHFEFFPVETKLLENGSNNIDSEVEHVLNNLPGIGIMLPKVQHRDIIAAMVTLGQFFHQNEQSFFGVFNCTNVVANVGCKFCGPEIDHIGYKIRTTLEMPVKAPFRDAHSLYHIVDGQLVCTFRSKYFE